jgi:hypothetical protein
MVSDDVLVETLVIVQAEHYKGASSARQTWPKPGPGFWRCGCGASGDVPEGSSPTTLHRRHLAEQIVRLINYGKDDQDAGQ